METQSKQQAPDGRPDRGALAYKSFDLELKALDDSGSFDAYVAVFNNVDRHGEAIAPGAFANLDEFVRSGWIALAHMRKAGRV